MRKRILILFAVLLLCLPLFLSGCGKSDAIELNSLSDMKGRHLNVGLPSDYDVSAEVEEIFGDYDVFYYDNVQLGLNAVLTGKADVYILGKSYIDEYFAENGSKGLKMIEEPIKSFKCGLGLCQTAPIENYAQRVNAAIQGFIDDGTIDDMKERWFVKEEKSLPELPAVENPEYTMNIVTFGQAMPYSFYNNNSLSGFDVELAYRVAAELGYGVNLDAAEYPAMLMGLSTGKYDMISANLYISEERDENVEFSIPYDSMDICCAVRDNSASSSSFSAFLGKVKNSAYKTFVTDNRYMMILDGFKTTIIITFFGFMLANVLGVVYCASVSSKSKFLNGLAKVYSRVMQGTPMTVVLLILFFVIFGNAHVSGVIIAIIGFGLNGGVSLGQLFYSGISSVDNGQKEAALALGLTKAGTTFGIVIPQAIRRTLGAYFGVLIELMKATSIVGYVAVVDLTRAGNIIQATTYEAFFPLIAVAVVYFLLSTLLLCIASAIQKKLLPKRAVKEAEE